MSEKYLPLFRKYRPQSFKDVVGQESLVRALSNAIELNRIANAYLFAGPRGTGKTSCARIFAKSLNCAEGPTLTPCQKCPSCLDITNASGLDVIEIDAATNRGIDDAKELIAQTQYAPMNGKYKIFIIDEVHMLSNEAFNALLKTFEEPPSNVIFILATTEPHKVIETIVSRCQRFDLRRITTDDIVKRLREISDIEQIKITDDALSTIAKNVSGGLRDSLALLDQVSILGAREEITKETIENLLGKVTFDVAFGFLNKILAKNIEEALSSLDEIYNKGLEPKNFCENFIEFLRNLVFALKATDEAGILRFTNFNKGDIEKIKAQNFDAARIFRILERVIEYYKEIRFTTNPYLWAELLVIALCKDEVSTVVGATNSASSNISAVQNAAKPVETAQRPVQEPMGPMPNVAAQEVKPQTASLNKPIAPVEPQNFGPSVVKEALKELQIPKNEPVKESPDDGVQNLGEYKEALYKEEKALASVEAGAAKAEKEPELPKMPEVPTEPLAPDVKVSETKAASVQTEPESPKMPEVPTTIVPQGGEIDPATAWANVLSAIESVPAKFFYSGVGKLVGIENKHITLGFVNENAISQAKSESKHKHLIKAIQNTLGADYSADFILITENTKVMDVKLTAKIQDKPKPVYNSGGYQAQNSSAQPFSGQGNPVNPSEAYSGAFENAGNAQSSAMPQGHTPKNAADIAKRAASNAASAAMPEVPTEENIGESGIKTLSSYGQKTREMLETFNGKVIE